MMIGLIAFITIIDKTTQFEIQVLIQDQYKEQVCKYTLSVQLNFILVLDKMENNKSKFDFDGFYNIQAIMEYKSRNVIQNNLMHPNNHKIDYRMRKIDKSDDWQKNQHSQDRIRRNYQIILESYRNIKLANEKLLDVSLLINARQREISLRWFKYTQCYLIRQQQQQQQKQYQQIQRVRRLLIQTDDIINEFQEFSEDINSKDEQHIYQYLNKFYRPLTKFLRFSFIQSIPRPKESYQGVSIQ
ncbi:hypothetical protein pb186bvf_005347 [Paramecium bursaria]